MTWDRFQKYHYINAELDFSLDFSSMNFEDSFLSQMEPGMQQAFKDMRELEGGAIANPDENRMVGHYWLRNSKLAPREDLQKAIEETILKIESFARQVHQGEIQGEGGRFTDLLVIGIGGSALGPQFVSQALGQPGEDRMRIHFLDNTDPDGIDLTLAHLRGNLNRTLAIVISKSGGTPETRNGMLEASQAFLTEGVDFAKHAVAITSDGSKLDKLAEEEGWIARFPMWDWVGGRTSETSAVGLLPAALQGIDIKEMLEGAASMDVVTRHDVTAENPAAILALMWYYATNGKGERDMVILPYKDRLMLFSKYLQQLIMESLGKEKDLQGKEVQQGIAVYGNKGSTDQHAYVQQLREGVNNFFVTFIEVKRDREGASIEVEDGITSGDYLQAFFLGTQAALAEKGRESIAISIDEVTPKTVGMMIALYERAVGFYASLVGINAYHQPGVEAGKKAAADFLQLQATILKAMQKEPQKAFTAREIAECIGEPNATHTAFKILDHLAANPSKGISKKLSKNPFDATFTSE